MNERDQLEAEWKAVYNEYSELTAKAMNVLERLHEIEKKKKALRK